MLPHDPKGIIGPKIPLDDVVTIMEPKEEIDPEALLAAQEQAAANAVMAAAAQAAAALEGGGPPPMDMDAAGMGRGGLGRGGGGMDGGLGRGGGGMDGMEQPATLGDAAAGIGEMDPGDGTCGADQMM